MTSKPSTLRATFGWMLGIAHFLIWLLGGAWFLLWLSGSHPYIFAVFLPAILLVWVALSFVSKAAIQYIIKGKR